MNVLRALTILIIAMLASRPAHAYLDPSTGSMIVTAIVGLFASIALAVKTYWYKLKALFRGDKKRGDDSKESSEDTDLPRQDQHD